ncbi:MAG: AAA family ATPase [Herminiimonas sp.]|nr:AAA family ATPase [Herminiimonas sp.]
MYTRFFGLQQAPFSIAPDPRYLFMSERHREALAHLLYGLNGGGGFVLLTGEIGAGKTTVCRLFLEQIPAHCHVAYIFNPKQTVIELLQSICDEFGVAAPRTGQDGATVKDFIDPLNAFLLTSYGAHRNNILIIDEAQNLSADVLEQLRLLTNLETNERKLLQIILIGQPELRAMLAAPELEQLAQRVIARFHLAALTAPETAQYITHRLAVAGNERGLPFSSRSMRQIHALSRGIPRRINLLCDRVLLGAYAAGKAQVDSTIIAQAAREVFDLGNRHHPTVSSGARAFLPGVLVAFLVTGLAGFGVGRILPGPAADKGTTLASSTPPAVPPALQAPSSQLPISSEPAARESAVTVPGVVPAVIVGDTVRELSTAYRQLGQLWNLKFVEGDPCVVAQKQNLHCFTSKNSLREIRGLDRPGILTLHDDQNQRYYGVLTGIGNQSATLRIGERSETVTLTALARRWHGIYRTFWRGPAGEPRDIAIGASGADVDWVATRLARVGNLPQPAAKPTFDAAMSTRVREFQLAQGLAPDGIPGVQTMMRLASVADGGEPHLQSDTAANTPLAGRIDPTLVMRQIPPRAAQPAGK